MVLHLRRRKGSSIDTIRFITLLLRTAWYKSNSDFWKVQVRQYRMCTGVAVVFWTLDTWRSGAEDAERDAAHTRVAEC